jgi:hypothetical protein
MHAWATALALAFVVACSSTSDARRSTTAPHYDSIDDATAHSGGYWRLTHTAPERRVRAETIGLTCAERVDGFVLSWLSTPEYGGYCSYLWRRDGSTPTIFVQLQPPGATFEALWQRPEGRGRSEARDRNIGRCRGVISRTTTDPTGGSGGQHMIVYALQSPTQMLSVRLVSDGPPPFYESDAEVIRLAELSIEC